MSKSERMTSLINRIEISSRELVGANDVLSSPMASAQEQADARSSQRFWSTRLRTAQMPLDALEVAHAANWYLKEADKVQADIVVVENEMAIYESSHPAYKDMAAGNIRREAKKRDFMNTFKQRRLEADDLFPPILVSTVEHKVSDEVPEIVVFEKELVTSGLQLALEPALTT